VQDDTSEVVTWGACVGMNLRFVRRHGLRFREELGRRGRQLLSGEDTTAQEMKRLGAVESRIDSLHVLHHVPTTRAAIRYVVRRVYWQGRTEVRRRNLCKAIGKEWSRYRTCRGNLFFVYMLAIAYLAVLLGGAIWEIASFATHRVPRGHT
jgi:hypothetical protein